MVATAEDLFSRWPTHPDIDDGVANTVLVDAFDQLTTLYPAVTESPEGKLRRVVVRVVCAMARRALMQAENEGVESVSDSGGPFSTSFKLSNPDGALYLTGQERELIENALDAGGGFVSVEMGGW